MITRVRIGVTRVTHSYILNKESEPTCKTSLCKLTVKNIFTECSTFHSVYSTSNINIISLKEIFGPGQEANIIKCMKYNL